MSREMEVPGCLGSPKLKPNTLGKLAHHLSKNGPSLKRLAHSLKYTNPSPQEGSNSPSGLENIQKIPSTWFEMKP